MARNPLFARRKPSTELVQRPAMTLVPLRPEAPPATAMARTAGRRALTASARPLDLTDKTEGKRLAQSRQEWQAEAWAYRRSVGELRYGVSFLGNAAQRMRVFAATTNEDDEVVPVDEGNVDVDTIGACVMALAMLGTGPTGVAPLLKAIMENFEVAGECYLVGSDDPLTGVRTWKVRSTSELVTDDSGKVGFRDLPNVNGGIGSSDPSATQWVDPASTFVARLWWPDPEWSNLPDSPVKAVLDILEELLLLGRDVRATARSRIANNGILAIPSELTVVSGNAQTFGDEAPTFAQEMVETASQALTDEGSAASTLPIVVEGPGDIIAKIKHIPLDRGNNKDGIASRSELLGRLATGIDLPSEVLTGKGEANHWSAWAISDDTFRDHIEPIVIVICDALTQGYLWPVLEASGVDPVSAAKVFLWYDPTELVTKPDRSADAKTAWDAGVISDEAMRGYYGFPESDAPLPREIIERLARQVKAIDPSLQSVIIHEIDPTLPLPATKTGPALPAGPPDGGLPVVPPKPAPAPPAGGGPPNGGVPPVPAPAPVPAKPAASSVDIRLRMMEKRLALLAAGTPPAGTLRPQPVLPRVPNDDRARRVQAANRQLVDIDRKLRERLVVAANAAVKTALTRAGAKIISKSRTASGAAIKDAIGDRPSWQIPYAVGPALRAAAGLDEHTIIDSSLADLRTQWDLWVSHPEKGAQKQALRAAARIAGLDVNTAFAQVAGRFKDDADAGFAVLEKSLRDRTVSLLTTADEDIELDDAAFVAPGMIRTALAIAGGYMSSPNSSGIDSSGNPVDPSDPMGQIGTGDTVTGVMEDAGANLEGYQWVHGASANPFEPHEELDGVVFADFTGSETAIPDSVSWADGNWYPGDHDGCTCDFMPVWTTPDDIIDASSGDVGAPQPDPTATTDSSPGVDG